MADLTMTGDVAETSSASTSAGRTVRRRRSLPRGRAVVGALLVTAAAVAVFAAYLDATGEPGTSYLVATERIEPGTRFSDRDELGAALGAAAIELPAELAERAVPLAQLDELVGWQVVAPLERGDLVTRSALVAVADPDGAQAMSFSLPSTAAVGGTLRAGERIDVVATFGSGRDATTRFVVRGLVLLNVVASDGGALGGRGDLSLTVAVTELDDVLALGHAINTADVFVTRSTAEHEGEDAPPAHVTGGPEGSRGSSEAEGGGG